jgi:hypothetical protein
LRRNCPPALSARNIKTELLARGAGPRMQESKPELTTVLAHHNSCRLKANAIRLLFVTS